MIVFERDSFTVGPATVTLAEVRAAYPQVAKALLVGLGIVEKLAKEKVGSGAVAPEARKTKQDAEAVVHLERGKR